MARKPYRPIIGAEPAGQEALAVLSELLPIIEAWCEGLRERTPAGDFMGMTAILKLDTLHERGAKALRSVGYVNIHPMKLRIAAK